MASSKTYVVPVDFSKTSEAALNHAIELSRAKRGKLLLIHVISNATLALATQDPGAPNLVLEVQRAMEQDAAHNMKSLVARKRLRSGKFRSLILRGDPAQVIARQAKKSRASMIIMGSHGRAGLERLMLGSVAERTLRYAECPVLIVK